MNDNDRENKQFVITKHVVTDLLTKGKKNKKEKNDSQSGGFFTWYMTIDINLLAIVLFYNSIHQVLYSIHFWVSTQSCRQYGISIFSEKRTFKNKYNDIHHLRHKYYIEYISDVLNLDWNYIIKWHIHVLEFGYIAFGSESEQHNIALSRSSNNNSNTN